MSGAVAIDHAAAALCELKRFQLERELGSGAFKKAYLAHDRGYPIAVKVAPINGTPERLIRESAALKTCSHAAIARVIDAFPFVYEGFPYWVVLEDYLSGGTLAAKIGGCAGGILDPAEVWRIGTELGSALEHLYPLRLVHRDIKPENILFQADGVTPVLTDFGIVRMLDQPSLTRDFLGMGPGTPKYAAPEQLNNEKALIDWRTDQFGLAIVLAECLIGRHPFSDVAGHDREAILAVASKQSLPLKAVGELNALGFGFLATALNPWPVGRFRRPADFMTALLS